MLLIHSFIRLVMSCLTHVSLMSTPEDKISALDAEIAEYRDMLKAAITLEEKKIYGDIITETRKTLNILLQQQQQGE